MDSAVAGCASSCHQATTAAATRSTSRLVAATARRRLRARVSWPRPSAGTTRAEASRTAPTSTVSTRPAVMVGDRVSPAAAIAGRCVRRAWTSAAAGTATTTATSATRSDSTTAAVSCWPGESPRLTRSARSSSRSPATRWPASSSAARASAVPSRRTTRTVERVVSTWACSRVNVDGSWEASRVIRARSPILAERRADPSVSSAAAALSASSSASGREGWPVTRSPVTFDPEPRNVASSTTKGPYAGAVTEPSLYAGSKPAPDSGSPAQLAGSVVRKVPTTRTVTGWSAPPRPVSAPRVTSSPRERPSRSAAAAGRAASGAPAGHRPSTSSASSSRSPVAR